MTQPLQLFAEITRLDEDARIAEGYCRTQGRVRSDPYNLSLPVLKRASAEYLRWSNVREMHDAKAAGNCLALEFDEAGDRIFIRAEIVDDEAWKKVKKGVYKGFSIGGRPTLLRGTDVVEFKWTETSLVDRPADPGAVITLFRRDDVPVDAAEEAAPDVERAGPDYAAGDAGANDPPPVENETEASRLAGSLHYDCGSAVCHAHKQHAAAQRCSMARVERGDVCIPDEATDEEAARIVARADEPAPPTSDGVEFPEAPAPTHSAAPEAAPTADEEPDEMTLAELTTRMDTLASENAALLARLDATPPDTLQRLETALTETQAALQRLESERTEMAAEIKRLGDQPAGAPVVRFPGAMTREIVQRHGEANLGPDLVKKLARFEELKGAKPETDTQAQNKQVEEMLNLQRDLRAQGIQV